MSGKLAVILHADIVGSTELVQRDEHSAHQRIQQAFQSFSRIISSYQGEVRELRGDALLAEFGRASDAVCAAVAFQADWAESIAAFEDDIRPQARVGIALGEVVIADATLVNATSNMVVARLALCVEDAPAADADNTLANAGDVVEEAPVTRSVVAVY